MGDDQFKHKWADDPNRPGHQKCEACPATDDGFTEFAKVAADCPVPLRKERMLLQEEVKNANAVRDIAVGAQADTAAQLDEQVAAYDALVKDYAALRKEHEAIAAQLDKNARAAEAAIQAQRDNVEAVAIQTRLDAIGECVALIEADAEAIAHNGIKKALGEAVAKLRALAG